MEARLALIEMQLWILIVLFAFFVATHAYWHFRKSKPHRGEQPEFGAMWEKDQIDELITKSQEYLRDRPNNQSALYFGAKALMLKQRHAEAARNLEVLTRVEPALRGSYQDLIDECKRRQNS